jgi:AcrR family transcriptional regulator
MREIVEKQGLVEQKGEYAMLTPKRRVDQRVQRTRQVLQQAFVEVAHEKGLVATTIQDITERADVNRGTFYLHFADKYVLMDIIIREQFHHYLAGMLPPTPHWDRKTLYLFIQALLDYLKEKYHHRPRSSHVFVPLFEQAIHEELTGLLACWLGKARRGEIGGLVPLETIASVASWAIFGAAVQWSQEETSISSERMAHDILLVVVEGMAQLVPPGCLE